jgi:hypothetical protein
VPVANGLGRPAVELHVSATKEKIRIKNTDGLENFCVFMIPLLL